MTPSTYDRLSMWKYLSDAKKSKQKSYSSYLSTLMVPKLGSQMTDFEKLIALVSSVLIPKMLSNHFMGLIL